MTGEPLSDELGVLRLQPHMIPRLKRGFADALLQLEELLRDGRAAYRIAQPAMGDPASIEFQRAFNNWATDGPDNAYDALLAFQGRLQGVLDTLDAIQTAYDRNEHATAAMLSRQLEP